jgi:hypothetical protein
MMVRLAMTRRYQMQMNDLPTLWITTVCVSFPSFFFSPLPFADFSSLSSAAMFQAVIIGSVYFQMPKDTSGFFSRGGVIFFAILVRLFFFSVVACRC